MKPYSRTANALGMCIALPTNALTVLETDDGEVDSEAMTCMMSEG